MAELRKNVGGRIKSAGDVRQNAPTSGRPAIARCVVGIAERDEEIPFAQVVRRPHFDRRQLGLGEAVDRARNDHGKVASGVGGDDLSVKLLVAEGLHVEAAGTFHDVICCEDLSVIADDDARAVIHRHVVGLKRLHAVEYESAIDHRWRRGFATAHGRGFVASRRLFAGDGDDGGLGLVNRVGNDRLERGDDVERRGGIGLLLDNQSQGERQDVEHGFRLGG